MKVGRSALDEQAIRSIEESHPDVDFNWSKMLSPQQAPTVLMLGAGRTGRPGSKGERAGEPPPPVEPLPDRQLPEAMRDAGELAMSSSSGGLEMVLNPDAPQPLTVVENAGEQLPSILPSASETLLGPELLERLRGRYAELLARISERVSDPQRREALRARAEAVNPDAWVTEEEARHGLESFESGLGAIRRELGTRRRRSRRRRSKVRAAETDSTSVDS